MDGIKGDECPPIEKMRETERFDVFLQARGDLVLIAPETVAAQLWLHGLEHEPDVLELFVALLCGAGGGVLILDGGVGHYAVEEEYDLF